MERDVGHEVKSKFDYAVLLEECLRTGSEYVLMVEDDVVFERGWWERTMDALGEVRDRSWEMGYDECELLFFLPEFDFFTLFFFVFSGEAVWGSVFCSPPPSFEFSNMGDKDKKKEKSSLNTNAYI